MEPGTGSLVEASTPPPRVGTLRLWFSTTQPVSRRDYLVAGLALAALKFAVEWVAAKMVTGQSLPAWFYFTPLMSERMEALSPAPEWFLWTAALWTLPFLWIAVSMSVRRALDAECPPWTGFLVALPLVNLLVAVLLSLLPTQPGPSERARKRTAQLAARGVEVLSTDRRVSGAWPVIAVVFGAATGMAMVAFSTLLLRSYGSTLFVATPLAVGAIVGFVTNAPTLRSVGHTISLCLGCLLLIGVGLVAVGIEGVLCLLILAPLALAPIVLGALLGRLVAASLSTENWRPRTNLRCLSPLVLVLPLLAALEAGRFPCTTYEVVTSVEVDAPPALVWQYVVAFGDLPEPDGLLFRLGVAYPQRARIDGTGVGAVRHCEFSTGPFVEPITAWDEPHRLAFSVSSQPPPMHEWSPYEGIHPPHLDGYLRSVGGEFRLTPLPGGRCRLEGSTWYELDLFPQFYFRVWADSLIHSIHREVLDHVKRSAEAAREHAR